MNLFTRKNKEKNYRPDYRFTRVTDITPYDMERMGAKAVALDLDNTVVPYGSLRYEDGVLQWADEMRENGYQVVIISNTIWSRAFIMSRKLGNAPFFGFALKPWTLGLRVISKAINVPVSEIAMVGDKYTTDILSANNGGAISVKVTALSELKAEAGIPAVAAAK